MSPVDMSVFQSVSSYRAFTPEDWSVLSNVLVEKHVPAGEKVFMENDPGDGFYWIRSGKVRISRMVVSQEKRSKQEQLLALLTSGNIFGEMALVDGAARSADASAENDTVVYYLAHPDYEKLKKDHPSTALRIQDVLVQTLSSRIRAVNRSFEVIQFWVS
jgi:CRP-like cAMP-binding protein